MRKISEIIMLCIFLGCTLIGCNSANQDANHVTENSNTDSSDNVVKRLCFKNEYPFQNAPDKKDVQELNLSIRDGKVTGNYNWLPAEKDARKGKIAGNMAGNVINAMYTFSQEGVQDSASITITLLDDKAIIKGGDPALGLDASLAKTDCNDNFAVSVSPK